MGAHGVSQAAAQALRHLQDQLAAAYTDLAACQVIPFGAIRSDRRLATLVDTLSPGMLFTLYGILFRSLHAMPNTVDVTCL